MEMMNDPRKRQRLTGEQRLRSNEKVDNRQGTWDDRQGTWGNEKMDKRQGARDNRQGTMDNRDIGRLLLSQCKQQFFFQNSVQEMILRHIPSQVATQEPPPVVGVTAPSTNPNNPWLPDAKPLAIRDSLNSFNSFNSFIASNISSRKERPSSVSHLLTSTPASKAEARLWPPTTVRELMHPQNALQNGRGSEHHNGFPSYSFGSSPEEAQIPTELRDWANAQLNKQKSTSDPRVLVHNWGSSPVSQQGCTSSIPVLSELPGSNQGYTRGTLLRESPVGKQGCTSSPPLLSEWGSSLLSKLQSELPCSSPGTGNYKTLLPLLAVLRPRPTEKRKGTGSSRTMQDTTASLAKGSGTGELATKSECHLREHPLLVSVEEGGIPGIQEGATWDSSSLFCGGPVGAPSSKGNSAETPISCTVVPMARVKAGDQSEDPQASEFFSFQQCELGALDLFPREMGPQFTPDLTLVQSAREEQTTLLDASCTSNGTPFARISPPMLFGVPLVFHPGR